MLVNRPLLRDSVISGESDQLNRNDPDIRTANVPHDETIQPNYAKMKLTVNKPTQGQTFRLAF